jgi:hypothetical protein
MWKDTRISTFGTASIFRTAAIPGTKTDIPQATHVILRRIRAGRKLIYLDPEARASAYSTRVAVVASGTSVAAWWGQHIFRNAIVYQYRQQL